MKQIPLIPLSYNPIDLGALSKKLSEYSLRHHDDLIDDFENSLRLITKSTYVVALNSGTAAIHLGLKALGIGQGDIVMASTFTYVASINPIRYLGAIPYFVDSDYDDWNLSPALLEEGIRHSITEGKMPKAILVVHTYGMPAKMKEIKKISLHYGIPILEDAAEALGSTYEGSQVGTIGEIGVLSFNNNKLVTTYGGGALITNDPLIATKINLWASQSRDNLPFYEHSEIGFNYKMSPLSAAMGLTQFENLFEKIEHRRKVYKWYQECLGSKCHWQKEEDQVFTNRWITACFLKGKDVRKLQARLLENKIESRPVWKPMHLQPVFKDFNASINHCAENLFESGICLPSGESLLQNQVASICDHVAEYLEM